MSTVAYTFEWPHAFAQSVYVTGTFDNWSKSTRLTKNGGATATASATVHVPVTEKILFKFVVDGHWTTDGQFKTECDGSGIENNVLYPEDIVSGAEHVVTEHSESETTTSFTNVSYGEFSPFEQCESIVEEANFNQLDLNRSSSEDDEEDLVSSAQVTLSGGNHRVSSSSTGSHANGGGGDAVNEKPVLVRIQEGNRQARYYSSMSLLSKFTGYFK